MRTAVRVLFAILLAIPPIAASVYAVIYEAMPWKAIGLAFLLGIALAIGGIGIMSCRVERREENEGEGNEV